MENIKQKNHRNNIYWITGQSGSGKTAIAFALQKKIGGIVLDGNEMRDSISLGAGFSKKDRREHNLRVARLAKILSKQHIIIIPVIAPHKSTRKEINKIIKPIWIYVVRNLPRDVKKPYEIPKNPHITVNSDTQNINEQVKIIISNIKKQKWN
jgi:adenylylsulfate kinase